MHSLQSHVAWPSCGGSLDVSPSSRLPAPLVTCRWVQLRHADLFLTPAKAMSVMLTRQIDRSDQPSSCNGSFDRRTHHMAMGDPPSFLELESKRNQLGRACVPLKRRSNITNNLLEIRIVRKYCELNNPNPHPSNQAVLLVGLCRGSRRSVCMSAEHPLAVIR